MKTSITVGARYFKNKTLRLLVNIICVIVLIIVLFGFPRMFYGIRIILIFSVLFVSNLLMNLGLTKTIAISEYDQHKFVV